ncbi:MAG: DUF2384 domain-containing protein [Sedimenticola sp.]|jgi:hypothetical protein|nr:MAG: DUF2384 domain-containing protein [Sedimenticola sp.]
MNRHDHTKGITAMSEMTQQDRLTLTKATMSILDSWKLETEQMRVVLGLPADVRARGFQKYRSHETFPDDPKVARCADYVLRIAGALRTAYPVNPTMGGRWLRQRHRRFGCTPLSVMLEGGEDGLVAVLAEVDCTFSWDLSGSRSV